MEVGCSGCATPCYSGLLNLPMDSCIHSAWQWLSRSGIQNASGGVARFYGADSQEYRDVSTQSTAFFISTFLRLGDYPEGSPPAEALHAGGFLLDRAFHRSKELFAHEVYVEDNSPSACAYFLGCSIIIRSLVDLWKATKEPAYLECAERCGFALQNRMSRMDGSFFPVYDFARDMPIDEGETWSTQAEVYQLKASFALQELTEATGLYEFAAMSDPLRRWCLKRHEGFVPDFGDPQERMSRLHAYCYFLEGLLQEASHDAECSRALQWGILRVETLIEEIGPEFQHSDVLAQLLRLRFYADTFGVLEIDRATVESEVAALIEFQQQSTDDTVDGGFAFARRGTELVHHINPVSTVLALQALTMWESVDEGAFREPWNVLI